MEKLVRGETEKLIFKDPNVIQRDMSRLILLMNAVKDNILRCTVLEKSFMLSRHRADYMTFPYGFRFS